MEALFTAASLDTVTTNIGTLQVAGIAIAIGFTAVALIKRVFRKGV